MVLFQVSTSFFSDVNSNGERSFINKKLRIIIV